MAPARRSTLYRARAASRGGGLHRLPSRRGHPKSKRRKVDDVHTQMADMAKAREAGEALAAAGDAREQVNSWARPSAAGRRTSGTVRHAIFARTQIGHSGDDETRRSGSPRRSRTPSTSRVICARPTAPSYSKMEDHEKP